MSTYDIRTHASGNLTTRDGPDDFERSQFALQPYLRDMYTGDIIQSTGTHTLTGSTDVHFGGEKAAFIRLAISSEKRPPEWQYWLPTDLGWDGLKDGDTKPDWVRAAVKNSLRMWNLCRGLYGLNCSYTATNVNELSWFTVRQLELAAMRKAGVSRRDYEEKDGWGVTKTPHLKVIPVGSEDIELISRMSKVDYSKSRQGTPVWPEVHLKDGWPDCPTHLLMTAKSVEDRASCFEVDDKRTFHILLDKQQSLRTRLALPPSSDSVSACPKWLPEMLNGRGPYGKRWTESCQEATQAFETWNASEQTQKTFRDRLKQECAYDNEDDCPALQVFASVLLQDKLDTILDGERTEWQGKVSRLSAYPHYRLRDDMRKGVLDSMHLHSVSEQISEAIRQLGQQYKET